jgi:hypothetical protein
MASYLSLAFATDSATPRPEKLYRQPDLMITIFCAAAMVLLLFIDLRILQQFFPASKP